MMKMMNNKRFVDNGSESIEGSGFEDTLTGKNYYVDYFDEIVDLVNKLSEENVKLRMENRKLKDNLPLEQTLKIIGEL